MPVNQDFISEAAIALDWWDNDEDYYGGLHYMLDCVFDRKAKEIEKIMNDPDRVRPPRPGAEVSTDFANDIEWACMIVRGQYP